MPNLPVAAQADTNQQHQHIQYDDRNGMNIKSGLVITSAQTTQDKADQNQQTSFHEFFSFLKNV